MAWTATNPVSIGNPTKKSHFDALWDNAQFRRSTSTGDFTSLIVAAGSDGAAATPFLQRNGEATGFFFAAGVVATSISGTEIHRTTSVGILFPTAKFIGVNTADASDNGYFSIGGGGAASNTRGGTIIVYGNEYATIGGSTDIFAGNISTGNIRFYTANSERVRITNTGGIGIGMTPGTENSTEVSLDITGSYFKIGDSRTAATTKTGALLVPLHTTSTYSSALLIGGNNSGASAAAIYIGGGFAGIGSTSQISFFTSATPNTATGTEVMRITSSGAIGIGVTTNINALITLPSGNLIAPNTVAGSDTGSLSLAGGGALGATRGGFIQLFGSDGVNSGLADINSGYDDYHGVSLATRLLLLGGDNYGGTYVGGAVLGTSVTLPAFMGAGSLNVLNNVYKNGTAYTNPDYVFEHFFTGGIEKFKNNFGAEKYSGLWELEKIEDYVAENFRLPGIIDVPTGIFDMADIALEKIEQLFLYAISAHKRIKKLEVIISDGIKN